MTHTLTKQYDHIDGLDISYEDGICVVTLNRPKKRNALTYDMYNGIRDVLTTTTDDDTTKLLYITGTGDYFCSGNDISNLAHTVKEQKDINWFQEFVKAFINYPKLIVVGVNGPAVGVSVTILGLTDFVYATDSATFHTPFMKLGLAPEGCSSYTFPKMMGYAYANDVLIGGRKLTAQEAYDRGLLTDVFRNTEFHERINEKLKCLSSLPRESVKYSKELIRGCEKDVLFNVNEVECAYGRECMMSEECMNAVKAFMTKRSKL